jgi:DNA polymerase-3 subunit gamma/tau
MRDGLSLLDQCATATVGELTAQRVYQCLGIAGERKCGEMMGYISQKNSRKALELFHRLYADGKDLGALLDEMACLTRDLLILKTAPDAGISMLSGVAEDDESKKLASVFSAGELLRIMELLQQTMSGFTRSASRRLDAELCILSLCQPQMQLDAQSLNARLSRLEEQIQSGSFVCTQKSAPQETVHEEAPPQAAPAAEQIEPEQPEPETIVNEAPVGFWADLVASVRQELKPPASGFFNTSVNGPLQSQLVGDRLQLQCANPFTLEVISKPEILSLVSRKASAILGRNIQVTAVDKNASPQNNARME